MEIAQNYIKIGAKPISSTQVLNMGEDFENIVTEVVQMAQKVAQMIKILKLHTQNYLKICTKPISSVLIMKMNEDFKNIVTLH